jgi:hypothetical protein
MRPLRVRDLPRPEQLPPEILEERFPLRAGAPFLLRDPPVPPGTMLLFLLLVGAAVVAVLPRLHPAVLHFP